MSWTIFQQPCWNGVWRTVFGDSGTGQKTMVAVGRSSVRWATSVVWQAPEQCKSRPSTLDRKKIAVGCRQISFSYSLAVLIAQRLQRSPETASLICFHRLSSLSSTLALVFLLSFYAVIRSSWLEPDRQCLNLVSAWFSFYWDVSSETLILNDRSLRLVVDDGRTCLSSSLRRTFL